MQRKNAMSSYRGVRLTRAAGVTRFRHPRTKMMVSVGQSRGGMGAVRAMIDAILAADHELKKTSKSNPGKTVRLGSGGSRTLPLSTRVWVVLTPHSSPDLRQVQVRQVTHSTPVYLQRAPAQWALQEATRKVHASRRRRNRGAQKVAVQMGSGGFRYLPADQTVWTMQFGGRPAIVKTLAGVVDKTQPVYLSRAAASRALEGSTHSRRNRGEGGSKNRSGGRQGRFPAPTTIQTLLFKAPPWTPTEAQVWALEHGFKAHKIDQPAEFIRIRQNPPAHFRKGMFRTITLTTKYGGPIKAIIGVPIPVQERMKKRADAAKKAAKNRRNGRKR